MKLEYSLSLGEFYAAQRLHYKRHKSSLLFLLACWLGSSTILLVAVLAIIVYFSAKGGQEPIATPINIAPALTVLLIYPLLWSSSIRIAYENYFPAHVAEKKIIFEADAESVRITIPASSNSTISWPTIVEFIEDKKMTLLYLSKKHFFMVPRKAMTEEQHQELLSLVRMHGVKG